jgi:drug/metabolite transporter (DMT)-like permease
MDGSIASPRPMLALGLRLLTALSLATMGALLKLAEQRGAHLLELIFWRQALTFLIIGGFLLFAGRIASVRTKRIGAHGRRAIYGLTGMMYVYGAVVLLPLAEATTISFTTPMFAVLLSMILFREKIGRYRATAIALGFAGVMIVMQPGGTGMIDPFGLAVGLIAAFMVALISIQIQDLNTTESPWTIVFWFTALTAPFAAIAMPFVASAHDQTTWLLIGAMAMFGAIAQMFLTSSLRYGSAATIIIMDYTSLIWATLFGYYLFDRLPPATLAIGAPLIIASGLLVAWRERVISKQKTAAADS